MPRSVANGDTTCRAAPARQRPGAAARARRSQPATRAHVPAGPPVRTCAPGNGLMKAQQKPRHAPAALKAVAAVPATCASRRSSRGAGAPAGGVRAGGPGRGAGADLVQAVHRVHGHQHVHVRPVAGPGAGARPVVALPAPVRADLRVGPARERSGPLSTCRPCAGGVHRPGCGSLLRP